METETKQIDPKTLSVETLKSLAYDELVQIDQHTMEIKKHRDNIAFINQEIAIRQNTPISIPEAPESTEAVESTVDTKEE